MLHILFEIKKAYRQICDLVIYDKNGLALTIDDQTPHLNANHPNFLYGLSYSKRALLLYFSIYIIYVHT